MADMLNAHGTPCIESSVSMCFAYQKTGKSCKHTYIGSMVHCLLCQCCIGQTVGAALATDSCTELFYE